MEYNFESLASYRIINHLYDERKDFIILGLCGRVGSGVSTVSDILEKNFEELQLPNPGFENPDLVASHEYRILYTYAKKNWKPFYKIKTSALITRHILVYDHKEIAKFLTDLYNKDQNKQIYANDFSKISKDFFKKPIKCKLSDLCEIFDICESDLKSPWNLFVEDLPLKEVVEKATRDNNKSKKNKTKHLKTKINFKCQNCCFSYDVETKTFYFTNCEMAKLVDVYATYRREKIGFQNPLLYWLLKEYLYFYLPKLSSNFWRDIGKKSESLPTQALQCLGNNLRLSKKPFLEKGLVKDGYVCLAEDINLAIKVLRSYQLKLLESDNGDTKNHPEEVRTIIVVDSIKNPYESLYLKARYNNYYLIGIYTEDSERRKRLRECEHLVDDDIKAIDIVEQNSEFKKVFSKYKESKSEKKSKKNVTDIPEIIKKMYEQFQARGLLDELSFISPFVLQNVSSCLDSADILINNCSDNKSYPYLKQTLLRYVSLIMNPGIVLPTPVEHCMQIANNAKLNSGCISRQVGAVLTDSEYHLLSIGWNQQPEGQLPCSYRDLSELYHHWSPKSYSDYENNDNDMFQKNIKDQVVNLFDTQESPLAQKGKLPRYCFKDYYNSIKGDKNQVHTRALHAEETAFLSLGSNKERVSNGILFTTSSPCELCAKKAMYMGVSTIYYVETYAGVSKEHVLNIGEKSKRPKLVLFTGAIGTAYTKLFTPLILQKDENEMWLGAKMNHKLIETISEK